MIGINLLIHISYLIKCNTKTVCNFNNMFHNIMKIELNSVSIDIHIDAI